MTRVVRIIVVSALLLVACGSTAFAASRVVQIRWDFTAQAPYQLEVWVDCAPSQDVNQCDDKNKIRAPQSYSFALRSSDKVVLLVTWSPSGDQGNITYAVTGTDVSLKDLDALKKLFGAGAGATAKNATTTLGAELKTVIKPVTDSLIGGGKLTVTFVTEKTAADGKVSTSLSSDAQAFQVDQEEPRITVSYGLGLAQSANPTLTIAKTSTIVSFTKNGSPQQAYQQVITMTDADVTTRPIQSLITLANFRILPRFYVSAGSQVSEKIFEEPIVGLTYRQPLVGTSGFNVTAGILFSHETEIVAGTGFFVGQTVDPTLGLTLGDITTTQKYHRRFALCFTIDF